MLSGMKAIVTLLGAGLLFAGTTVQPRVPRAVVVVPDSGTIRIHLLDHAIGNERFTLAVAPDAVVLADSFDFTDRGGRIQLQTAMRMATDLTPVSLRAKGKSYRFVNIDADVQAQGTDAIVHNLGDSARVSLPPRFFTIAGYAPLAAQALLVRYWESHGRPRTIAAVPANPINTVVVEYRGVDTVSVGARRVRLRRYAIDGVAWGRETLWLDENDRFAAIITRANMLPLEGVRTDLDEALPAFQASSIADRLKYLARAADSIAPIAMGTFALSGGRIIDGIGGAPIEDGVVIVRAGRITAVGARSSVSIPAGTRVIDARGKTITPGLWDIHTHVATPEWGAAYLGVGVTTIRDMGGERAFLVAFRDAIAAGRGLGPRLLMAGLVDGGGPEAFGNTAATTPEEGRAVVDAYHAAGFQQMKLYTVLKADVAGAIIRRAHELGMTVTGHVPRAMTLESYVDSGADMVAHMVVRGDTANAMVKQQIAMLARHHVVSDPTLSWNELLGHANETPIASFQPGYREAPWSIIAAYGSVRNAGDSATINGRQRAQLPAIKALYDAGVPVVAGTDYGLPGFSLLRELELYVDGGLTPMQALQSATKVPAEVMGLSADVGTIAVGKRADLLVLDANPLDAIANVRTGRWVVSNGRMYECAGLRKSVGFVPVR